jgi:SAM-dependent methyltransferase
MDRRSIDTLDRRAATYSGERIRQFNAANAHYPPARAAERDILLDLLALRPGLEICDVAAGGGYLAGGIERRLGGACRTFCLENSRHFLESPPDRYTRLRGSLSAIPLPDASVDRVGCLVGLHHQEDKRRFFAEAGRVLRQGGVIAVGEVAEGSPPARFLNEAVDRWSDLGHDGMFFASGALTELLQGAGFDDVEERVHAYTWIVPDLAALVWYCRTLFRMSRASLDQVEVELRHYLRIDVDAGGAHLHWSLVCASARAG